MRSREYLRRSSTATPTCATGSCDRGRERRTAAPDGADLGQCHRPDRLSNKFWEISVDGCEATVRYGRIGTAGTSKVKTFADAEAAQRDADKLIAEKTGKGYVETGV